MSLFFKQVALLSSGTALAQLVNIVSLPILSRLYTINDFGAFALYISTISIVSVVSTLKLENSILAAKTNRMAFYIVLCIVTIGCIVATIVGITFYFIGEYNEINISYYSIPIFISVLTGASQLALYNWANRNSLYGIMTKGLVLSSLLSSVSSIAYGYYFRDGLGLVIGSALASLFNVVYILSKLKCTFPKLVYNSFTFYRVCNTFMIQRDYPKYLVPSGILDRVSSQMHIFLFSSFFSLSVSGALSLHNKVVGMPTILVGRAIGDVFKRKASELIKSKVNCDKLLMRTSLSLFLFASPIALILYLFAPQIYSYVLGDEWFYAGEVSRFLAFNFLIAFSVSPITSLFHIGRMQKKDLFVQMYLVIVLTIGLLFSVYQGSIQLALYVYSFSYISKYIIQFTICFNYSRKIVSSKDEI